MLKRQQPGYKPPFELIDFLVNVEHRHGRGIFSEATVKVRVDGEVLHTAAEGDGPVNALDAALRKALVPRYPAIAEFHLADYKVRILDGDERHRRHHPRADRHAEAAASAGAPSARAPTSSRPAGARWPTRSSTG